MTRFEIQKTWLAASRRHVACHLNLLSEIARLIYNRGTPIAVINTGSWTYLLSMLVRFAFYFTN